MRKIYLLDACFCPFREKRKFQEKQTFFDKKDTANSPHHSPLREKKCWYGTSNSTHLSKQNQMDESLNCLFQETHLDGKSK